MELIKNAYRGWLDYTEAGKLTALVLLALLLYWFGKRKQWSRYGELFTFTTVMTVCCICPLTAAVLMLYQTRFYDYQWIWGIVPVTIVLALNGTLLWTEAEERCLGQRSGGWKLFGIGLLMLCLLYFSSGMGNQPLDADSVQQEKEEAIRVLEMITEDGQNTNIVLWAPKKIMEYARMADGNIRLPYGRNMWDPALNAYSYETYGEEEQCLYEWMTIAEESGDGDVEGVKAALELGVNHILLPGQLSPELLSELESCLGMDAEQVGAYYWFYQE